jgi:hypothetical protein
MAKVFFTGGDESAYTCTLLIFQNGYENVHSFHIDFDESYLNIVKRASGWEYHSGRDLYLDRWIAELGKQADSGNFG